MDLENYDQLVMNSSALQDALPYLMEGMQVGVTEYEGEALEIEVPLTVEIPVAKAETGVKGDTATGATKTVTLSTGLEVQVPLFIDADDIVRIDTRTGKYLTRA
jgi:elongation factor P